MKAPPSQDDQAFAKSPGRRASTIANLVHQYVVVISTLVYGVLMVPLYLKYFNFVLYGAWLSSGNIIAWLGISEAGVNDLIRQRSAHTYGQRDLRELGAVIGTGMVVNAALSLFPMIIGLLLASTVPRWFDLEGQDAQTISRCFWLAALQVTLMINASAPGAVQQGLQRNISHCVIFVISTACGVGSTVAMVLSGWGIVSIPIGLVIRWAVAMVLYWGWLIVFIRWVLRIRVTFSADQI